MLPLPVVLLKSANAPLAVLLPPVVLLRRAPAPIAVFSSAVLASSVPAPLVVLKLPFVAAFERKETKCRIECAAGEA